MQIVESKDLVQDNENYSFDPIENKIKEDKVIKENLTKWGLIKDLDVFSFRFNLAFSQTNPDQFLLDLFNSQIVRSCLQNLRWSNPNILDLQFEKLSTQWTSTNVFDKLEKEGIVSGDYLKGCYTEFFEDIEIPNLLRESLLLEESDYYLAFDEYDRKELLFRVFKNLVLGGQMCQYEDKITPYVDMSKLLYKQLVSARKDNETQKIFIESQAFEITKIDEAYPNKRHPQNFLYVVVSPSLRQVNIVVNQWNRQW